ncbi:MAG: NAD-dependent epimerase/dehydratase family protein [Desulfatiglandaceae bacterium]|jgi:nucleoside-diphosphate-sugar epimerase
MNILVTGANGFIGRALCSRLASDNKVVGIDITRPSDGALNIAWERADLTDFHGRGHKRIISKHISYHK